MANLNRTDTRCTPPAGKRRMRSSGALLAGIAVGAPLAILSILTTPPMFAHEPTHRQIRGAYRWRWVAAGAGAVAGLALVSRQREEGRLPPLGKAVLTAWAGLAGYTAVSYDPHLFRPRRSSVAHRPAEAASASFEHGDTDVIGVWLNGEGRAYSMRSAARPHLMVDRLGGETIIVSFCGLTHSAIAYRADADGLPALAVLSAPAGNVVYRDARSGGLVQQLLPHVASGPDAGHPLCTLPVMNTDWATWRRLVPESTLADQDYVSPQDRLLSRAMRYVHRRTRRERRPFLAVAGDVDRTLHPKASVFALCENGEAFAYTRSYLRDRRVVLDRAGNSAFVIFYAPQADIAAAYRWHPDMPEPSFCSRGDTLFEHEPTGAVWDILGRPVIEGASGERNATLEPVPFAFDKAFWFSWKHWHPETRLRRLTGELDAPIASASEE